MKYTLKIIVAMLLASLPLHSASSQSFRVYETLGSYENGLEVALESAKTSMESAEMQVLSAFEAGRPDGCSFDVGVISFVDPFMVEKLVQLDRKTAPYAIVNRIVLFGDEEGGHIAFVNPRSIYRTVFQDALESMELADEHRQRVRSIFSTQDSYEYGQARDRGLIGKTMGVMAGGVFGEKIKTIYVVPNASQASVADQIEAGFGTGEGKWGLEVQYRYDLGALDASIFGVAGRTMEARSFSIVGAGDNDSRDSFSCPGTAYAAAYPLEMYVVQVGADVQVQIVEAMFRMKMYFEDAGKWAFMKNMGMPGSLADEMGERVKRSLDGTR